MKKIFFAILASFALCGAMQAQGSYKVLNIIKDGVAIGSYKLSEFDCLTVTTVEAHEYVDLGLPSGTLWAIRNVGATKPEEYGDYFAWGETTPKDDYSWKTYKYGSDYNKLTKYCTDSNCGTVDNKTVLEFSDDAATVNWGNGWRMPTWDELQELRDKCTWTWTTLNGVNGQLVTGPNGNSIFLPAAGCRLGTSLRSAGNYGHCWSSSLDSDGPYDAYYLRFDSGGHYWYYGSRLYGRSVRPVRASPQN